MTARARAIALVTLSVAMLSLPLAARAQPTTAPADPAIALYASLSDEQRQRATLPFDAPERDSEVFTGGRRAGVQIDSLDEPQRRLALDMLTAFTSPYGRDKAQAIARQDDPGDAGLQRYYVCFFGEPGPGKTYAWRIAEHHLTIVHVEVEKGEATTFGPILLGADPPTLWDDEEEKMIALFAALSPQERERANNGGRGTSSLPPAGRKVKVADLNPTARQAARAVLENRLAFFSDRIRQRITKLIDSQGGVDAMEIAFYGEAAKKCRDGGRWDFKLAGPSFLCDYENSRGHIHLSMKGKLAK
ncbi:MAG TPA: DUF3500 domain-containing protein [Tepidisphaeraceae bacterium]|nr:DUF3500 domain-containing protein [Tepidisphaeraceae bacterium]